MQTDSNQGSSKALLATLVLLLSLCGRTSFGQVNVIEIPASDIDQQSEILIKKLVALPRLKQGYHIFEADTIVRMIATCQGNGVYQFGPGPSPHTSANYIVVARLQDKLLVAQNIKSREQNKQLLQQYFAGVDDKVCGSKASRKQLLTQVLHLIEANTWEPDAGRF